MVNLRWRRSAEIHLTEPRLTFLYFELLGGVPVKKKTPCIFPKSKSLCTELSHFRWQICATKCPNSYDGAPLRLPGSDLRNEAQLWKLSKAAKNFLQLIIVLNDFTQTYDLSQGIRMEIFCYLTNCSWGWFCFCDDALPYWSNSEWTIFLSKMYGFPSKQTSSPLKRAIWNFSTWQNLSPQISGIVC